MRASFASGHAFDVHFDVEDDPSRPVATKNAVRARRATWPLALCALVATLAALAAVTESPLGQRPVMRSYTDAAHVAVANARQGLAGLAHRAPERP